MEKVIQRFTTLGNVSKYTLEDVRREIHECANILSSIGYKDVEANRYNVAFSKRLMNTYGRCKKVGRNMYTITINEPYLRIGSPENIHNTIMHEVIHSVQGCMNHGAKFKAVGRRVNENYKYTKIETYGHDEVYLNSKEYLNKKKYKVVCNSCGKEWLYQKTSKVIKIILDETGNSGKCTCPNCKSNDFKVIKLR